MIEVDTDVPAGIDAVRAVGTPTREDYDTVVVPLLDAATREGRRLRFLLHAPSFPGWENLRALVQHLRFVGGHQRRIARAALAVDGQPVGIAARVAGTLLHPEVRHFAADEVDDAIAWAGDGTRRQQLA